MMIFIIINNIIKFIRHYITYKKRIKILVKNQKYNNIHYCKHKLKKNGFKLKYINNPNEELCKIAIEQSVYSIKYAGIHKHIFAKYAVSRKGLTLKHINEHIQTEDLCICAINENPYALQYVINQTDKICILALSKDLLSFRYIKNKEKYRHIIEKDTFYKCMMGLNTKN